MFLPMSADSPGESAGRTSLLAGIRDAVVDDAVAIESVHFASRAAVYEGRVKQWPPRGPDQAGRVDRWREWLRDPSIHCLVAEQDAEIVGFCTVRGATDEDLRGTATAEMPTLYVRPDSWHAGFGRALCSAAVERAAAMGFERLVLWVLRMNERARAFYEEFGFRADGTEKVDTGSAEGLVADRFTLELDRET